MDDVDPDRAVMIRLRARLAVVERAAWFGLVQAMRTQPAETEAYLTAERASALKALSDNFYATAFQAEDNDPEAVRFLCDMLGLDKLLALYDAECSQAGQQPRS